MRNLCQLIVVASLVAACSQVGTARAAVLLGPVANPANGHNYYMLNQSSWTSAEAEAEFLGGHLATVRNAAENTFVFDTFSGMVPSVPQYRWLWIGLNEVAVEGDWKWASGEAFAYSNWAADQPDDNGGVDEDFVGISLSHQPLGLWHDVSETNTGNDLGWGVVEVVPEPSSGLAVCLLGLSGCIRHRRGNWHLHAAV